MLIIGYHRSAAAGAAQATITALAAQTAPNPTSPFGAAAHVFTQDVSSVPGGARCLLVGWGRDSAPGGDLVSMLTNSGAAPTEIIAHGVHDGTRKTALAIWQWTKASENSVAFTVGFNQVVAAIGFQLFYLQNTHASTVTAIGMGSAIASSSCALSSALGTAANGIALFAAAGCDSSALTGSWDGPATEHADASVEQYLQIHSASYATDGKPLHPTLTFSGTNDNACMVAVAIPPA